MTKATFDALAYFEKLKNAGFTEEQAKIQANTLNEVIEGKIVSREYLDLRINDVDARLRETELRLQKEIEQVKYALLKWQIAGWLALAGIMAKGFGWLGF